MDVGDEHLVHVVQRPQEGGFLAIPGIHADPFEPHPPRPRLTHDIQRMLAFRGQRARLQRNTGPLAPCRIVDPGLRQIQPHVHRRMPLTVAQHAEHSHLAVVDLAQPSRPLASHTHRTIALLGKAAFVDDQAAGRLAAQQAVSVPADLRHNRLVVPWRIADEMLELLRAACVNHGRHRREGAVFRLRQAAQITPCHRRAVSRLGSEEPAIAIDEGREGVRDPLDQRSGQLSSGHNVT